jgi:MraZ protein
MLLTGTFPRSVDDKLRVAIPKTLRHCLGDPAPTALFVAPGNDGSIVLYTESAFTRLAERLERSSPTQEEVRAFSRLFYAQAQRVELDSQGRVRIPPELAERAGLGKEAVLLGVQDRMELWDKERWEAYRREQSPRYDELAEKAFHPPGQGQTVY